MMKAQGPRFETCLFGPDGEIIYIKPYRRTLEDDRHSSSSSNDDIGNGSSFSSGSGSGNSEDGDDKKLSEGLNHGHATNGLGEDGSGEPLTDDDEVGHTQTQTLSNATATPPQTPIKSSQPPSRPIKPPSTAKKSKRIEANDVHASNGTSTSTMNQHPNQRSKPYNHNISIQELRRLSSQGVPDDCTLRPLAWRVLLGYLPLDTSKWQAAMDRDRNLYANLVQELFVLSEDYPFESEGQKLRGRGLKRDGEKVSVLSPIHARKSTGGGGGGMPGSGGKSPNDMNSMMNAIAKTNLLDEAEKNNIQRRRSPDGGVDLNDSTDANANGIEEDEDEKDNSEEPELEIPQIIMDQWRKSGRDPESLRAGMDSGWKRGGSYRHINALLVSNNDTANAESNDAHAVRKVLPLEEIQESNSVEEKHTSTSPNGSTDAKAKGKSKERIEDIDPKWKHFLENASLLDEIRKDVVRTHPDLQFFLEPNDQLGARRYAAIERVLFIWAKLNKGVRYVQGMNEIVGTMYFVLANDENEEWASQAEADTYFLFNTLMVEMRDIFVPDLDEADTGIQGRMANMLALLSLHDPEVRCHLDDCGIDPAFYSIRWLTTLLSREFLLPDTIRLWDSMFASTHKDNFMRYVCVCMVMIIREDLLKGDFGTCLRLLQSYPPTDVDQLLESSRALWIYESQVTLACHKGGISLSQALTTIAPPPAVIMAYGLNGGLALDQLERMRKEVMDAMSGKNQGGRFRKNSLNLGGRSNVNPSTGKSFFGFFGNKK